MKPASLFSAPVLLAAALLCTAAQADVTEAEAIEAQLGSALASADFAARNCPGLGINDDKVQELLKRIKKTAADLRAGEDYDEQRTVVQQLEKQQGRAMVCMVLPSAHGGYARGVIQKK
jgi:hypothetical protein